MTGTIVCLLLAFVAFWMSGDCFELGGDLAALLCLIFGVGFIVGALFFLKV